MSDPHLGFIVAAYGLGFVVIAGMVAAILYDQKILKRALAKLPGRGEGGPEE
ncbi:heme exporter protein CcmD [Methyloferula stellata]|uniref:heme exporter protein CcmD n=1 Tax=Methyloferula stellata TaxID=876270 RepID=UPI0003666F09|nr:heme exporter protein CcmD [Methyloferula stellata]